MGDTCDDCGKEHEYSQKVDMKPGLWGLICVHCRWFNYRGDALIVSEFLEIQRARSDRLHKLEDAIKKLSDDSVDIDWWGSFMYSNEFMVVLVIVLILFVIRRDL